MDDGRTKNNLSLDNDCNYACLTAYYIRKGNLISVEWEFSPDDVTSGKINYSVGQFRQDLLNEIRYVFSEYGDEERAFLSVITLMFCMSAALGRSIDSFIASCKKTFPGEQLQRFLTNRDLLEAIEENNKENIEMLRAVLRRRMEDDIEKGLEVETITASITSEFIDTGHQPLEQQEPGKTRKVGRNDPCPCGSGKKYKKCCLSRTYADIGKEEAIKKRLVEDLLRFLNKKYRHVLEDTESLFWDEFVPEEHLDGVVLEIAEQNFWEWVLFDYPVEEENDKTIAELYLESNKRLSLDEHRVLTMMKSSIISLYEVQEVFPEKGLLLKDLLLGGEYDVRERSATRSLKKWDIYAARLFHVDGKYIMSGSVYPYHIKQKQDILDDIRGEYEDYRQEYPEAAMDEFLKMNSEIFNFYWYDTIQNPTPLKLHTTSGEPVLFSKAIFEFKDREAVMNGLSAIKGFEQENEGFTWFDERDKDGRATLLGRVTLKGKKLTLESNSKERLEKGKRLILGVLSDAVVHKADTYQDPMEAVKSFKERPPEKSGSELPLEVQQQFYSGFMKKHYEKWLKDKLPALDGETPLEAVKTETGKKKVIDLLKLFENGEELNRREGRPTYDLSWVWERLGLEKE